LVSMLMKSDWTCKPNLLLQVAYAWQYHPVSDS
jgi:hypothetical protein